MSIRKRGKTLIGIVLAITMLGFAPGAALGLTSWYGANYAYDWGGAYGMGICDMEADGDPAYARYETTGSSYRLDDSNGSQPGCTDQQLYTRVYRHHVCEGVLFADPCGAWVYP